MPRHTNGSKLLPLAMTVALAGTSWVGLAGGLAAPQAQAQRENKDQDDRERRERERKGPDRPPERPAERREERRDERAAPPPARAPQQVQPQQQQEPRRDFGRTPHGDPRGERQPPQREAVPPQREVQPPARVPAARVPQQDPRQGDDDRRGRERGPEQARPDQPRELQRGDGGPDRGRVGPIERRDGGPDTPRVGTPERRDGDRSAPRFGTPERRDGGPDSPRFGGSDRREGGWQRPARVGPERLDDVKRGRVERTEGGRRVIEEPGNRVIIRDQGRMVIRRDEGRDFERFSPDARSRDLGEGRRESWFERPDGTRVYSEVDRNGRILRRWRRDRGGREVVFIDNRRFYRDVGIGIGVGALGIGVGLSLAPPRVTIPRDRYIVDYDHASDDDLYDALSAPPIGQLDRAYSLDEIRYSAPLRDYMRRIDLDTVNFEFGSFEVAPDQFPKLARLARIVQRMLERNEAEVFLIEGHTDAVGSDEDNLTLSDRRAESVADILVSEFGVPVENLVTQGYGEQYLKVETDAPERLNRRVAFRRITPLLGSFRDR